MIDPVIFLPLFIMGLVSSAHCIGMCGGIMGALTMAIPANARAARWMILVAYNLGRIASYVFMGVLVGLFAEQFAAWGGSVILRVLAGTLLIAMGLYLADWWRGITKLETVGRYLWVYIQPIGKQLMPVNSLPKALLLGALWGWLPCGLVYAALAASMTQPAPALAGTAMLAFGLGTLPAVLAAGVAAHQISRLLQKRQVRVGLALVVMIFGCWTIWGAFAHTGHHHSGQSGAMDHSNADHSKMDHSQMDHANMNHADMDHSHMQPLEHSVSSAAILEGQRTDITNDIQENNLSRATQSSASSTGSAAEQQEESHSHHH